MNAIIAGPEGIDLESIQTFVAQSSVDVERVTSQQSYTRDFVGETFAETNDLALDRFSARWNADGQYAAHKRNARMCENADVLLALYDGEDVDTKNLIVKAIETNLPMVVEPVDVDGPFTKPAVVTSEGTTASAVADLMPSELVDLEEVVSRRKHNHTYPAEAFADLVEVPVAGFHIFWDSGVDDGEDYNADAPSRRNERLAEYADLLVAAPEVDDLFAGRLVKACVQAGMPVIIEALDATVEMADAPDGQCAALTGESERCQNPVQQGSTACHLASHQAQVGETPASMAEA